MKNIKTKPMLVKKRPNKLRGRFSLRSGSLAIWLMELGKFGHVREKCFYLRTYLKHAKFVSHPPLLCLPPSFTGQFFDGGKKKSVHLKLGQELARENTFISFAEDTSQDFCLYLSSVFLDLSLHAEKHLQLLESRLGVPFTLFGLWQWVGVGLVVKNLPASAGDRKRSELDSWAWKIPWRRKWQPTPVFLPVESHGQRSLSGDTPWGHRESDTIEVTQPRILYSKSSWNFLEIILFRNSILSVIHFLLLLIIRQKLWVESQEEMGRYLYKTQEIKPVNPKGNQPSISIGRTVAEAPVFWPPDAKR